MPEMKNLRGNLGNLSCSRKQFGSHRMAFLNVKKTYSYQVKKKKKKNPSAFDKKSKSPFFKIMTTQFCVWAIIVLLCNLVTQASTTGLNRKMFWSLTDIFEIKILNMNEVSKTQKLLEITSKEWKCNAKKNA